MDVFALRDTVLEEYRRYVGSFIEIRDPRIQTKVEEMLAGQLWPEPLLQLNPSFEPGPPLPELVRGGLLHPDVLSIFCAHDKPGRPPFRLHRHQVEGIEAARAGDDYVLTTGTGSGKSLSYIVPIVDHVLRRGSGRGVQAIIVYPMNALANSQEGELRKFLDPDGKGDPPVTFARYTGQEDDLTRAAIKKRPPDIILTNYVMLELMLTRTEDAPVIDAAKGLRFLVLDELHTYRGRQGADVAMLVRRLREACASGGPDARLQLVGTSATLSTEGSLADRQAKVAEVASKLFGNPVRSERIIGETLRRVTPDIDFDVPDDAARLRARVAGEAPDPSDWTTCRGDLLASWIESELGLRWQDGQLVRSPAAPLGTDRGLAARLAAATGLDTDLCAGALREMLLVGANCRGPERRPLFAFRLHQFVSKGDAVYASPEREDARHLTLKAQQFVPGTGREKILLPLATCRECGKDYAVVFRVEEPGKPPRYIPRALHDQDRAEHIEPGYLHIDTENPWPANSGDVLDRLPESWLEWRNGAPALRSSRRKSLPRCVDVRPDGVEGRGGTRAEFITAPFRFCLACRVAYSHHQRSDFGKLATLGTEGRSTATTVLSLSAIRELRGDAELDPEARKLLTFSDNRQDASLQAGHFNDFVEVVRLRSALFRAVRDAGRRGIRHDRLTERVFETLDLPLDEYARNPDVEYLAREDTEEALREVIGHLVYRDLQRGWRITSPNLEQCGLLRIDYRSLDDFCADERRWSGLHEALAGATPAQRATICRVLLDHMRRELAIRVGYLDGREHERLKQLSYQWLREPWAIDPQDDLPTASIVLPRGRIAGKDRSRMRFVFVSERGGFGYFLRRVETFPEYRQKLTLEDSAVILRELCKALTYPGILQKVREPRDEDDVPGYQLAAAAMVWLAGDGTEARHDPIRVPDRPEGGLKTNPFFVQLYQADGADLGRLLAREHTAQVPPEIRAEREEAFRAATLPILYCSPTMELGVDINQLNVVGLRNVPPTPANYAQRSGRAGRSGQPALVFTYCSARSGHDQYFFNRQEQMVDGAVSAPRIDVQNESLLLAHVHAIWFTAARLPLGKTMTSVLDVSTDEPTLVVLQNIADRLADPRLREQTIRRAQTALGDTIHALVHPHETVDEWLRRAVSGIGRRFEEACQRWRDLYLSALEQAKRQSRIINDASRTQQDRGRARRLRDEAERQLALLRDSDQVFVSDFYTWRYLATEGFLPGYNFPRLPLSAYLPGRRADRDDVLNRPRFLAIREFGPRNIIYHEGAQYVIDKAILPVDGDGGGLTRRAVRCTACGYLHPLGDEPAPDLCRRCSSALPVPYVNLFRMQNVSTRRRQRITSDEEERTRMGYELITGVRFSERYGELSARRATLVGPDGREWAHLTHGDAAVLWRINLGWRRRKDRTQMGFLLDTERGYWSRKQEDKASDRDAPDDVDPATSRYERVVPYVEDTRNCLLIEPVDDITVSGMASLQAALKTAIERRYQLEDRELGAEPLPSRADRRVILLYEASEGGAGVLRDLVETAEAFPRVMRDAIELCHFDTDGIDIAADLVPDGIDPCEAGCYDCLLSYYNQGDHALIDRHLAHGILTGWLDGTVETSSAPAPREQHLAELERLCDSGLERMWLRRVHVNGLNLPSAAQVRVDDLDLRVDFLYAEQGLAVFVDGPHHDAPEQRAKDTRQTEDLEDIGYGVVRFRHDDDWDALFGRWAGIFGKASLPPPAPPFTEAEAPAAAELDLEDELDLHEPEWHPLVRALFEADLHVDPGNAVTTDGRSVGLDLMRVRLEGAEIALVDEAAPDARPVAGALRAQGVTVLAITTDDGIDAIVEAIAAELHKNPTEAQS